MKYSSRFFLYAPIAVFAALAAAVSLYWWHAAGAFETRLAALKGRQAVPGVTLDWSSVAVGGFPFRVDAVFTGFTAHGDGPHGPFRWQSDHVALHRLSYRADRAVLEAAGSQRLSYADAAGQPRALAFQPGTIHGSVIGDANGLTRLDVDIAQLTVAGLGFGRLQFHLRRATGDAIDMVVSADAAKGDMGPLGNSVQSFRLYQTLPRAAAFLALLKGENSPAAAQRQWRQAGGAARVTRIERDGKENGLTPEQARAITAQLEALY